MSRKLGLAVIKCSFKASSYCVSNRILFTNRSHCLFSTNIKDDEFLKDSILLESLKHVSSNGWTTESILKGVEAVGLPPHSHTIITNGPADLVHYFLNKKRNDVKITMNEKKLDNIDDILFTAISTHIDYIHPYLDTWPSAIAILLDPVHLSKNLHLLLDIIDDICEFTNFQTFSLDWYSERIMIATIYILTELYMLTDNSENLADTKSFLKRNIEFYNNIKQSPNGFISHQLLFGNIFQYINKFYGENK